MVKLTDLDANFYNGGGDGILNADGSPAPKRTGLGVMFNCPCGCGVLRAIPFANPIDGGPSSTSQAGGGWRRTGDTLETLTLEPSILFRRGGNGCGWHGWIRNGEIVSC